MIKTLVSHHRVTSNLVTWLARPDQFRTSMLVYGQLHKLLSFFILISPGKRNKRGDFNERRKLILITASVLYVIFGIGIYGVMQKSIIFTLISLALLLVVRVLSIFQFIRFLTQNIDLYHILMTLNELR